MTAKHHPNEAILADYAGGALRPAFSAVVAAHLETCALCRAHVGALEAAAGELLGDLAPAPMDDEALARVMAGIERPGAVAPGTETTTGRIPFGRELWVGPGMGIRKAKLEGGDLLYLLRLPAGLRTIPHGHEGIEYTAVLKGAFDDGHGVFAAGDFGEMLADEVEHRPSVLPGSECVCLIASERPMRVRTFFGHLVHRLTGV